MGSTVEGKCICKTLAIGRLKQLGRTPKEDIFVIQSSCAAAVQTCHYVLGVLK